MTLRTPKDVQMDSCLAICATNLFHPTTIISSIMTMTTTIIFLALPLMIFLMENEVFGRCSCAKWWRNLWWDNNWWCWQPYLSNWTPPKLNDVNLRIGLRKRRIGLRKWRRGQLRLSENKHQCYTYWVKIISTTKYPHHKLKWRDRQLRLYRLDKPDCWCPFPP